MVSGFKAFTVYSWRQARLKKHLTAESIVEHFSIYSFKKYLMSTNYIPSTKYCYYISEHDRQKFLFSFQV